MENSWSFSAETLSGSCRTNYLKNKGLTPICRRLRDAIISPVERFEACWQTLDRQES